MFNAQNTYGVVENVAVPDMILVRTPLVFVGVFQFPLD